MSDFLITEIHNPASVGWRVRAGDTELEIAWPRHTQTLIMGLRHVPDGPWRGMVVLDRERWGHDGTQAGAKARAVEFLEEALAREVSA